MTHTHRHALAVLAVASGSLWACMAAEVGGEADDIVYGSSELTEVYRPGAPDTHLNGELRVVDGVAVVEGDVVLGEVGHLPPVDVRSPNALGFVDKCARVIGGRCVVKPHVWPRGTVYYQIGGGFSQRRRILIRSAIQYWRTKTSLRFVPRTAGERVRFKLTRAGCWSNVGYRPGRSSTLGVSGDCSRGNIIHEIGHAVGLWHEHTRCDRSGYIRVLWDNIVEERKRNFATHCDNGKAYTGYDYGSIMHYSSWSFSKNGKRTLEMLRSGPDIGQRSGLSGLDRFGVFRLYRAELNKRPAAPHVQAFEDDQYRGRTVAFSEGTYRDLGDDHRKLNFWDSWAKRISSFTMWNVRKIYVCDRPGFQGNCRYVYGHRADLTKLRYANGRTLNDHISSMRVFPGQR